MYFHSFTPDGQIHWQGEVLDNPTADTVRIRLFSWLTGAQTDVLVLPIADTRGWQFYKTEAAWLTNAQRSR